MTPTSYCNLITYKVADDLDGALKSASKAACNFWNRFVTPSTPVVIRVGLFTAYNSTIARAYEPYVNNGIKYGAIEFNTEFLKQFSALNVAATITHELGHTLGFGWSGWHELFHSDSGRFTHAAIQRLPALAAMFVETDHGDGTRLAHWDEEHFDSELMTGFKDSAEHVLPVTIQIMELLGHRVNETLPEPTALSRLLHVARTMHFLHSDAAAEIDREHYQVTPLRETIPHSRESVPRHEEWHDRTVGHGSGLKL